MNLELLAMYLAPAILLLGALVIGVARLLPPRIATRRDDWFERRCEFLAERYPMKDE